MDERAAATVASPSSGAAPFWSEPVDAVLARTGSSAAGLSAAEAAGRLARFGPNRPASGNGSPAWRLALRQVENPLVLLLIVAAAISWFLDERDDAALIFVIVAASSAIGFWQEWSAGNAVRTLLRMVAVRATVLRDGRACDVPVEELVPGDVVQLAAGSIVPADARLMHSNLLFVDEASLTGESYPAEKLEEPAPADAPISARRGALYAGTHVLSGTGTAVLVATGSDTEFGHVMERLKHRPPTPEFERGLQAFGMLLVRVTLLLVVGLFALTVRQHGNLFEALMFALAISVGITPELLPAIVSINLARGARRMAAHKVIVKRLAAIEDFGSMTVLCSDKTGTLTEGTVHLSGSWSPAGSADPALMDLVAANAGLQSGLPSPIDDAVRAAYPLPEGRWRKLDEVPYDFHRKRLSVLAEGGAGRMLITKGSYRTVLEACTRVRRADGDGALDDAAVAALDHLYEQWSADGLRVLGVATRAMEGAAGARLDNEAGMTFAGFVTLSDQPKEGIREAIAELRSLGIALKVLTGDNRNVAAALAARVGLGEARVLTGDEIRRLSPAALSARAEATDVFAEVEPNQKERILRALQKAGHVVGFLGDGINDAPALHTADVGISVDSAVDVAKEAAEIVLLDHDLAVLAEGVMQGRTTFENTLKYIYITTSANFGNMLSMALAATFLPFLPLLPVQVLLNNFLSDVPAMTIGGDRVDPEAAGRPGRWDIRAIRNFMVVFGSISSAFDFLTFGVLVLVLRAGPGEFRSAWFLESLLTEIAILLVMRTRRSFVQSRPSTALLAASVGTSLVAAALVLVPALATPLGFAPLPLSLLATILAITLAYVAASEAAKRRFFRATGTPRAT